MRLLLLPILVLRLASLESPFSLVGLSWWLLLLELLLLVSMLQKPLPLVLLEMGLFDLLSLVLVSWLLVLVALGHCLQELLPLLSIE